MAAKSTVWVVPDATDLQRVFKSGGVAIGDFILEFDNNTLNIVTTLGLVGIVTKPTANPSATTSLAGSVKQITAQASLTDSTGGTPSTTFAAIAAGAAYAQADIVAIKNALAQIALQFNNLKTAMEAAGQSA